MEICLSSLCCVCTIITRKSSTRIRLESLFEHLLRRFCDRAKHTVMALHFIKSQRGKDMLIFEGFLHNKERKIGEKVLWKCAASYTKLKCPGRVHTKQNEVVKKISHNHDRDPTKTEVKIALNSIKETAKRSESSTQEIIASVCDRLPTAAAGHMPHMSSLRRTVQRIRGVKGALPTPSNLIDLRIPSQYTLTRNDKPFLMYDSGPGEKRILIFSTADNLEIMANSEHWFADGTFKCTPQLFSQLYTIHAVRCGDVIPMVYALLPDKSEETYVDFLQQLKILQPELRPNSITSDFEKAPINAFRREFPSSRLRGCFVHFTQCLSRSIHSSGLQHIYCQDSDSALHFKQLAALSYVPEDDVVTAYEKLLDSDFFTKNESSLIPLLDHFEDTWIGRYDRRGHRRPPIIPLSLWNSYNSVKEDLPRINNAVEEWQDGFSQTLNAVHPNLWKLIKALQREESLNRLKIQIMSGNGPRKKKIHKDTSQKMKKIVDRYAETPILDYLRLVAQNFQLKL